MLGSTQCTTKRDLFLFSLSKHKIFLDLERRIHKSTLRGRETFCTTSRARSSHLGSLMEIRSRAATSEAERSMPGRRCRGRWRRRREGVSCSGGNASGAEAAASRCSCAPSDRARVFRWVWRRTGEPRTLCRRPPPFFIAQRNGGPPTIKGWTPPIRARIKGLIGRWAY